MGSNTPSSHKDLLKSMVGHPPAQGLLQEGGLGSYLQKSRFGPNKIEPAVQSNIHTRVMAVTDASLWKAILKISDL